MILRAEDRATPTFDGIKQGLQDLALQQQRVTQSLQASSQGMDVVTRSGGRNSLMLLELSRAAEDASVGFSLNGLQGAVRGAGNNIAAMATMISPLAGGIAGLGIAALALAPSLLKMGDAHKSATDAASKHAEELQRVRDEIERLNKAQGVGDEDFRDSDAATKKLDEIARKQRDLNNAENLLREQLGQVGAGQAPLGDLDAENERRAALREQAAPIVEELRKVAEQRHQLRLEQSHAENSRRRLLQEESGASAREREGGFQDIFGLNNGEFERQERQRQQDQLNRVLNEEIELNQLQVGRDKLNERLGSRSVQRDQSEAGESLRDLLQRQIEQANEQIRVQRETLEELRSGGFVGVGGE